MKKRTFSRLHSQKKRKPIGELEYEKKSERHIFGDEWKSKIGGRRKSRSSKKDKANSKSSRYWMW